MLSGGRGRKVTKRESVLDAEGARQGEDRPKAIRVKSTHPDQIQI